MIRIFFKSSFVSLLIIFCYCSQDEKLYVLDQEELNELYRNNAFPDSKDLLFKNQDNKIISFETFMDLMDQGDYFEDYYKNTKGTIVELRLRKKIRREYDYDCQNLSIVLNEILISDQKNGREGFNQEQDWENLLKVESILQKCGISCGLKNNDALFLVLQHSHLKYREKYIDHFRKAAKNKCISFTSVAYMEDRISIEKDFPQKYGTQFFLSEKNESILFPLINLDSVDIWRKSIGLNSLEEYMLENNIRSIEEGPIIN